MVTTVNCERAEKSADGTRSMPAPIEAPAASAAPLIFV